MAAGPSIDLSGYEQLAQASPDLLRQMVTTFVQALMGAEADAICGLGYGVRSDERSNTRNGYRRGTGTPVPARSSWRSRSCVLAATSRTVRISSRVDQLRLTRSLTDHCVFSQIRRRADQLASHATGRAS
jgi:hypothetical protein